MNPVAKLRFCTFRLLLVLAVLILPGISVSGQVKYSGAVINIPGESVSPQLSGTELRLLFDGVADLYYSKDGKTCYYYITDNEGRLFTLSVPPKGRAENGDAPDTWRQGFVTVLRAVMKDTPSLAGRIETVIPERHEMTALMREYHDAYAKSGEIVYYEAPPPAFIPHFGLFASYSADYLKPASSGDLQGYSMDRAFYPVAGISLEATMPRISEKFSIILDLGAAKRYFYGYYNRSVSSTPSTETYRELHMHNYMIIGNMKAGYAIGSRRVKPLVSGGLCFRTIVTDDSRIEEDMYYGDIIISDTYDYSTREQTSFGLTAGIGLSIEISGKMSLRTSLDYSELFITGLSGSYRSAGLKLGVNF